ARLASGDRVEEDPERDARQEQRRVARAVLLLALDAVGRRAELVDRVAEVILDLLVGRDARGQRNRSPAAEQLVVHLASGLERAADVVTQILVRDRPLDVGPGAPRPVQ